MIHKRYPLGYIFSPYHTRGEPLCADPQHVGPAKRPRGPAVVNTSLWSSAPCPLRIGATGSTPRQKSPPPRVRGASSLASFAAEPLISPTISKDHHVLSDHLPPLPQTHLGRLWLPRRRSPRRRPRRRPLHLPLTPRKGPTCC